MHPITEDDARQVRQKCLTLAFLHIMVLLTGKRAPEGEIMQPAFECIMLIIRGKDVCVFKNILTESLMRTLTKAMASLPARKATFILGSLDDMNVSFGQDTDNTYLYFFRHPPLSYQQVKAFEAKHKLTEHPDILFIPKAIADHQQTSLLIEANVDKHLPWDKDLV